MKKTILTIVAMVGVLFLAVSVLKNWEKIDKATCHLRGGEMVSAGCGLVECHFKCVVPYRDAEKPCTAKSQCSHRCITTDARLPYPPMVESHLDRDSRKDILKQCVRVGDKTYDCAALNLSGNCEKAEPANCAIFWELNKGVIKSVFESCAIGFNY